jgi:hypothetical protein
MKLIYIISIILIIKTISIIGDYECNFYNERVIGELLYLPIKPFSIHSRTVTTCNVLSNQETLLAKAARGDYFFNSQDASAIWYLTPVNRSIEDKFYIRNSKSGEYMYASSFSDTVKTLKSTSGSKNFKNQVDGRREFMWEFKRPWSMIKSTFKLGETTIVLADKYTILNVAENRYLASYKYTKSGVFVDSSQPHGPNFNWIIKCRNAKFLLNFVLSQHLF